LLPVFSIPYCTTVIAITKFQDSHFLCIVCGFVCTLHRYVLECVQQVWFIQHLSKNNNNKTRIFILKLCNDTHADISFKLKAFSIYITILVPSTCRAFKNAELVLCCLFRSSFDDTECDIFRWEKNCVIWRLCSEK